MNLPGILVMAKAPIPGQVKTRLCPPCTPDEAAEIAQAALHDTLDAAMTTRRPVVLALAGEPGAWLPPGVRVVAQIGGSFNERLAAAWTQLPFGGVQIGMDTPQVAADLFETAFGSVEMSGSALGPAADGGWWILGLSRPDPRMFAGIAMSTHQTGRHQLERLRALGHSPVLLPTLTDIDSWDDAREVAASMPGSRTHAVVSRVVIAASADRR